MAHHHGRSREELHELEIFHRYDRARDRRNLAGFYGRVAAWQDAAIARHVVGRTVLDVGAGYGTLARRLIDRGFAVTAIDPDPEMRELARKWHGVAVEAGDVYATGFGPDAFDTVILREVGEHLDFEDAAPEVARIAGRAVILFQTNVTPLVRAMRALARHREYRSPPLREYRDALRTAGLRIDTVAYMDVFSLALSGGFTTRQWLPRVSALYTPLIAVDDALGRVLGRAGMDRALCWRVLVRATKGPI